MRTSNGGRTGARSALDGAGGHAADEEALEREEHDERHEHGDEAAGGEQVPLLAAVADEALQRLLDDLVLLRRAEEDQGDEEVVPDPQELQDRDRRQHRVCTAA